ncbi:VWA domain-containing protein [Lachnoanaerobaculum umeaense]|uniref:Universal stress protein n=1 Tax=Lachnoanaerobaculum umeaense TaxID=617123 RepID=A0A385Q1Q6_9FIRM|nr:VWA domain-containing protein [Lachnoanaerobaculum umeaense]AYB00156.1 universal stress protein [Lachnoanaerobaculum umeaense]PZW94689.1 stress response protein SCP2 [Lachnoanaerobaculum umeaense]
MVKGWKDKLENHVNLNENIFVDMNVKGNAEYDFCCFGVDENGKLSDDGYMIFYNQRTSPNAELRVEDITDGVRYTLNLSTLPDFINRLVFTVSIDGNQTMGEMNSLETKVYQSGDNDIEMKLGGKDFTKEKAVIVMEIYRKDVWRIGCVASGFDGGLSALLKYFGGEEVKDESNQNLSSSNQKILLEKKMEKAPELISLVKPLVFELKKKNLESTVAKVGLVLDISGSMVPRFKNGTVQSIVNKTLPLAVQFDDDGELDFWFYGTTARQMDSVNLKNYTKAVPDDWKHLMMELGGRNNEPIVMRMVVDEYKDTKIPAYVLFITDGGVNNKKEIRNIITEASHLPIFWQFVGVGGKNYGVLEKLDTMTGRYVDNAGFFALDDFQKVSNEELYARLLEEFPAWLEAIRKKGMI